jgi:hypothetical protein
MASQPFSRRDFSVRVARPGPRHRRNRPHGTVWRAGGRRSAGWTPGAFSIARFVLLEQGSGTTIVFDHTGFPKGDAESLATGWKSHYWDPLAAYLA